MKIQNSKLNEKMEDVEKKYKIYLNDFKFNEVLAEIWSLIGFCDKYINETKPWEDKESSKQAVQDLIGAIREIAQMIAPFLPETSEKIIKQIESQKSEPLFPRVI